MLFQLKISFKGWKRYLYLNNFVEDFFSFFFKVSSAEEDRVSVKLIAMGKDVVRISFHLNIGTEDVPKLCTKLKYVLAEIKNKK